MTKARTTAPIRRLRRVLLAGLATATMLVLTACGAVISTTLTIENDGSGSRVMVLTLPVDDMDGLATGTAGVDASIRKRLPAELSYSGIQGTADGGATATFTLDFASTDDYKTKAQALLALGGNTGSEIDFSVTDSLLVKGTKIDENFTSSSLLAWMFEGLLADGVVAQSDSSSMYEVGDTTLNVGGISVPQGAAYGYSNVTDNGFASVTMATDISEPDKITRIIRYTADPEKFADSEAVYDAFFEQSSPDGADLEIVASGIWELTFSGNAESVTTSTDTALDSTTSSLSLESEALSDDPATLITSVTDIATCENICASDGESTIIDTVSAGANFAPSVLDLDLSITEPARFTYTPAITSANADFEFGLFGGVTATVTFVVPNADVKLVGDGFDELFRPAKDVGSLSSTKGDTATTFTTVIKGDDVTSFATTYEKWASGSGFGALEDQGASFFSHSVVYDISPALGSITKAHPVTGQTTTSVRLPFGQSVDVASGSPRVDAGIGGTSLTYEGADSVASVRTTGLTLAGFISIAVLLLAALAAVVLLVRHRRKVLARLRAARDRLDITLEPGDVGVPSVFHSQHDVSPFSAFSAGSVFDVPSVPAHPRTAGSMFDLPRPQVDAIRPGSVFDMSPALLHHGVTRGASVLSLPSAALAAIERTSLFDRTDAHGISRSGASTN